MTSERGPRAERLAASPASSDRAERPERDSRADHATRPERDSRADHATRPARDPRADHATRPDRAGRLGEGGRPDRGGRPEQSGRPDRGGSDRPRTSGPGARSTGRPTESAGASAARREAIEQREYDPRREERRKATRVALPEDADPRLLDADTRRELRSLSRETAELVSRHLVVTGRLIDEDPEQALTHARAARALAGRIGVVRLATGLAAYAAGEWNEALSELRAARRITGRPEHLAVFADCERALGRPERALAYGDDPEVSTLSQDERVELVIVLAGARRDMGQADAAVLALQDPARRTTAARPWAVRIWYAYADALLGADREDEAREWFGRAADLDVDGQTDAADRVLALDGVVLEDSDDDEDEDGESRPVMDDAELAAYVAESFGGTSPTTADVRDTASPDAQVEVHTSVTSSSDDDRLDDSISVTLDVEMAAKGAAPDTNLAAMAKPFSGTLEQVAVSSSRPAAALTPTFAAASEDTTAVAAVLEAPIGGVPADVSVEVPADQVEPAEAPVANAPVAKPKVAKVRAAKPKAVPVTVAADTTADPVAADVEGAPDPAGETDEKGDELTLFS